MCIITSIHMDFLDKFLVNQSSKQSSKQIVSDFLKKSESNAKFSKVLVVTAKDISAVHHLTSAMTSYLGAQCVLSVDSSAVLSQGDALDEKTKLIIYDVTKKKVDMSVVKQIHHCETFATRKLFDQVRSITVKDVNQLVVTDNMTLICELPLSYYELVTL